MIQKPGTILLGKELEEHLNAGGCIHCSDFYRIGPDGHFQCMPESFAKKGRFIWQRSLWGIKEIMLMKIDAVACLEPGAPSSEPPVDITMEQKILNILGSKRRTGRTTYAVDRAIWAFTNNKSVELICPNRQVAGFVFVQVKIYLNDLKIPFDQEESCFEIYPQGSSSSISVVSPKGTSRPSEKLVVIYEHTEAERQLIEAARLYDQSVGGRPFVVHCKKSKFDVYVGRPTKWGNPYEVGKDGPKGLVVAKYRTWLESHPELKEQAVKELRGKILGCWCSTSPCHAEVLAEVANGIAQV